MKAKLILIMIVILAALICAACDNGGGDDGSNCWQDRSGRTLCSESGGSVYVATPMPAAQPADERQSCLAAGNCGQDILNSATGIIDALSSNPQPSN